MALEKEMEAYRQKLPELTDQEGKFALFHGDSFVDVFTSYEDAVKAGYEKFKLEPFLVRQIQAVERVQFVSRMFDPCAKLQSA
jgi:hypothetical protein